MEISTELQHLNALVEGGKAQENLQTQQYLAFNLGDEDYGVDILRVQEIKSWVNVALIPNTPIYLCGVLSFRGMVIPVVDLRLRFGMAKKDYSPLTIVIVLTVTDVQRQTEKIIGIVVDAVSDTYTIAAENIKPSPDFGKQLNTSYLTGLVAIADKMLMILDIDALLSAEALA
ncbi:MAG: purine-binding chemotaxis protein CheW [Methylophagaceae bacterium]|jgi:purine-binding chemotaxis protein CheW